MSKIYIGRSICLLKKFLSLCKELNPNKNNKKCFSKRGHLATNRLNHDLKSSKQKIFALNSLNIQFKIYHFVVKVKCYISNRLITLIIREKGFANH